MNNKKHFKYIAYFLVHLSVIIIWSSCRKDFESISSNGNLRFSTDTIHMDTLFTGIKSEVKRMTVYNDSDEDIHIPEIYLEQGNTSKYSLNVNGSPTENEEITDATGKYFENVPIMAQDSIFVFVETHIDVNEDILDENQNYNDRIIFDSSHTSQNVVLTSVVKDANYIILDESRNLRNIETNFFDNEGAAITVEGYELTDEELLWDNDKAVVIYGNIIVTSGKTLTINAGARIHFHEDSGLIIEAGGKILMEGNKSEDNEILENEIIIEGDRIAEIYDNLPGQWGFIWIQEGSTENEIRNTTIKNASIGLLVEGELNLENVQIYNTSGVGMQANNATVNALNLCVNNCQQGSVHLSGGNYEFQYATIANHDTFNNIGSTALRLSNYTIDDSEDVALNAQFTNCIISGDRFSEITYYEDDTRDFNIHFSHCLIQQQESSITQEAYNDLNNTDYFESCIFNDDPNFKDTANNDFRISEDSPANAKALATENQLDISGNERNLTTPDIGAYESSIFDE